MNMFTTRIQIPPSENKISHQSVILSMGSCFAENMGKKLENALFDVQINPFGVLFNPLSISMSIRKLMNDEFVQEKDVFEFNGLWNSYQFSNLFSGTDKNQVLQKMNESFCSGQNQLKNTDFLILTFGTSWIYELKETRLPVANCHKIPAEKFRRKRLSVNEIVEDYSDLILQLRYLNSGIRIIFSVSPVRHWKDGAHENNLSKSVLLLAIDEIVRQFENVQYFPSWEIQMDELRDYRFYADDMLHPSQAAVDYIWERFGNTFFNDETVQLKTRIQNIQNMIHHRPIHPDAPETEKFHQKLKAEIQQLSLQFPFLSNKIKF